MKITVKGTSRPGTPDQAVYTKTSSSFKLIERYLDGCALDNVELSFEFTHFSDFDQMVSELEAFKHFLQITRYCMWSPLKENK